MKKLCALLAVLLLMISVTGCISVYNSPSDSDTESSTTSVLYYPSRYYYSYVEADYISDNFRKKMNTFGEITIIEQAEDTTEIVTEFREGINNASGTPLIAKYLPELDQSKYTGGYGYTDTETGMNVSVYYRVVDGMLTDEMVKFYLDQSRNVVQYETVNWGKYDGLNLDESQIKSLRVMFENHVHAYLDDIIFEYFAPTQKNASSAYILFTDSQGRLVISTRVKMQSDVTAPSSSADIYVDLFAVIG